MLVGMQQLLERAAHDLFDGVPEDPLDRRALVEHPVVGIEHRDQVARVLDESRETLLARAPVDLGRELGASERERRPGGASVRSAYRVSSSSAASPARIRVRAAFAGPAGRSSRAAPDRCPPAASAPRARARGQRHRAERRRSGGGCRDVPGDRPYRTGAVHVQRHRPLLVGRRSGTPGRRPDPRRNRRRPGAPRSRSPAASVAATSKPPAALSARSRATDFSRWRTSPVMRATTSENITADAPTTTSRSQLRVGIDLR